ncbi:MAG: ABC transporter ATP-binding protein [Alphaproteobacteria bacterium]|nr:ABC transporter ATP-binding protein [Alphaproteobacteria bacterium]
MAEVAPEDLVIDVRGLTKRFGDRTVVRDVALRVRRGEIFGFLGPNGSGKTTTIRMLCGLLEPSAGEGQCIGYDIRRDTAAIKRQVGYMTQRFSLYEDLTIRENLAFIARLYGMRGRRAAVDRTLERLGLTARQHQPAGQLSGGWKQRLALASCVMHEPKLLLLDEPTAGVDPKARREFWDEIHALAHGGLTVLVSTHYMDEAERCHRIGYIFNGRLLTEGSVADVVRDSGLVTWSVEGASLAPLRARLSGRAGIDMVVPFGAVLHVAGSDEARLAAAIAPFRDDPLLRWTRSPATLEDVFIRLMSAANGEGARP